MSLNILDLNSSSELWGFCLTDYSVLRVSEKLQSTYKKVEIRKVEKVKKKKVKAESGNFQKNIDQSMKQYKNKEIKSASIQKKANITKMSVTMEIIHFEATCL